MNPDRSPVARELFAQWRQARGHRPAPAARPFSRAWEALLEDARLESAIDRADAERDVRALARDGWLDLKPVRYQPHLIHRLAIPLDAEPRWQQAFGFSPPSDDEARRIRDFPWHPALAFLRHTRLNLPFDELLQLHRFLTTHPEHRPSIPIKERSLEIFGDEKRLDALWTGSALFTNDRLTLDHLRCHPVPEPLGWLRGPPPASTQPVIVLENLATWDSFCRWNRERALFSAVVYGGGNRFRDGVIFLAGIFNELGGPRPILYFGDLDPAGLRIPRLASQRAQSAGLPPVEPHLDSYRRLLEFNPPTVIPDPDPSIDRDPVTREDCAWLGPLAHPAWELLSTGRRLAQEHLGWERLAQL